MVEAADKNRKDHYVALGNARKYKAPVVLKLHVCTLVNKKDGVQNYANDLIKINIPHLKLMLRGLDLIYCQP